MPLSSEKRDSLLAHTSHHGLYKSIGFGDPLLCCMTAPVAAMYVAVQPGPLLEQHHMVSALCTYLQSFLTICGQHLCCLLQITLQHGNLHIAVNAQPKSTHDTRASPL